jgi:hypothetical protein
MSLEIAGRWFVDAQGRSVLLRGVNLGGSSKLPAGCHPLAACDASGAAQVSFVGRPFPLADAAEHFGRLRHWGFNCLRFLVTWEAVEHAGPGRYDEDYLQYLGAVVAAAGEYGFHVFINPHQDAWSRFSGGDGAPAWTLELAGFNLETLDASEAAITMGKRFPNYPAMVWPNNWKRLACATMFTLFFAGDRFAPGLAVSGEGIQGFLQRHFIAAMRKVARRLADLPHVIGYGLLNEPCAGYVGVERLSLPLPVYNCGPQLTGLDSLAIPAGFPKEVPLLTRGELEQVESGRTLLNPSAASAWIDPERDIWRKQGVWDLDARGIPRLLRDDHFAGMAFFSEGVLPFARRYAEAIVSVHPEAAIFLEGEPGSAEPLAWDSSIPVVNASHWYDLLTLTKKHYNPSTALVWGSMRAVEGEENVRKSYADQIAAIVAHSAHLPGGAPTLVGEFGLPFDLDGGSAYRTGDFTPHTRALSSYYDALDAHLVHSTLWNYTPDNTNAWGDQWNQEDLSIYSVDQRTNPTDPDSGARALEGFCRPTMRACAGTPLHQEFQFESKYFTLDIDATGATPPTLVYLPKCQYPQGFHASVSSGHVAYDPTSQFLIWTGASAGLQTLHVGPTA